MRVYLTSIEINGVKNLENSINLTFVNKTINKNFSITRSNVKSIYGPNGSGKSAIIHAMNMYENIIYRDNYLVSNKTQIYIRELMNKKISEINLTIEFILQDKDDNAIKKYGHYLRLVNSNEKIVIDNEKLFRYINSKTKEAIIDIEQGKINKSQFSKVAEQKTYNLLSDKSIVSILSNSFNSDLTDNDKRLIFPFYLLSNSLYVYLDDEDAHNFYIYSKMQTRKNIKLEDIVMRDSLHSAYVKKENFKNYSMYNSKLEKFLKIFKPELKKIELRKKEDKDFYIVDSVFVYQKYRIDLEFESAGIKRLIGIYNALNRLEDGMIVFFDELDANINDVYLSKMIEFVAEYTDGQFIFTTHSLAPMEVLKDMKHSIDFLNNFGSITPWIKSGNYSPVKLYRNGLVSGLPFNVEGMDFINVFGGDDE